MGAFGYGVLENDDSLDAESDLLDWLKLNRPHRSGGSDLSQEDGEAILAGLLPVWAALKINRDEPRERQGKATSLATLAVLVMESGAAMTQTQRETLIERVNDTLAYDCVEPSLPKLMELLKKAGYSEEDTKAVLKLRETPSVQKAHSATTTLVKALERYDLRGGSPIPSRESAPSIE